MSCCSATSIKGFLAGAVPGAFAVDIFSYSYSPAWLGAGGVVSGLFLPEVVTIKHALDEPLIGFGLGYFTSRGYFKNTVLASCMVGLATSYLFAVVMAPKIRRLNELRGQTSWGKIGSELGEGNLTKNPTPTPGQGFPGPLDSFSPLAFNWAPN